MGAESKNKRESLQQFIESFGVPKWLVSGGITSIMALCLGVGIAGILYIYNLTAAISVPLLLAAVVAVVAFPLVKLGDKIRLPRAISSVLVIFLLLGLGGLTAQITFNGVISQAPAIGQQITTGVNDLAGYSKEAMVGFGIPRETADGYISQLTNGITSIFTPGTLFGTGDGYVENGEEQTTTGADLGAIGSTILQGASAVGGFLSGLAGGILSVFFFVVFLYYFLSDFEKIRDWLSSNLFADKRLGISVLNDVTYSLSGYFRATTLTAVIVAIAIGIPLWLLEVPLVVPIIIVTILTAYIPFIGALIASAFTVLIALASGGIYLALIAIVIMLIANNVLQTFVSNKLMGDYLNLHPLAVLIATLFGMVAMGLVGAALGAPFLAIGIAIYRRIKKAKRGELTDKDLEERIHNNESLHNLFEPITKLFKRGKKVS
jgi:predicted PurR-regulated permease PerM